MNGTNEIEELKEVVNDEGVGGPYEEEENKSESDEKSEKSDIPPEVEIEWRLRNIEIRLIRMIDEATIEQDLEALESLIHAYEVLIE